MGLGCAPSNDRATWAKLPSSPSFEMGTSVRRVRGSDGKTWARHIPRLQNYEAQDRRLAMRGMCRITRRCGTISRLDALPRMIEQRGAPIYVLTVV